MINSSETFNCNTYNKLQSFIDTDVVKEDFEQTYSYSTSISFSMISRVQNSRQKK